MTVYTSLFLPPSIFAKGSSYNASLLGSSGNTSTLAIKCLEAVSQESPSCGPMASVRPPGAQRNIPSNYDQTTTITVGPTTFAMTSVSTGVQQTVTITEICILTPAKSTAVCNVNADTGLFAPFRIDAAQYNANM